MGFAGLVFSSNVRVMGSNMLGLVLFFNSGVRKVMGSNMLGFRVCFFGSRVGVRGWIV